MAFNSMEFAFFLPVVFIVYWKLPYKYQWIFLLISNYFFYMSWNPKYIILILTNTFISYIAARLLEKQYNKKVRKLIFVSTLSFCLGILFFFKYFMFVSESIISIWVLFTSKIQSPTFNLLLPVGISFYTFQTLSYVIDVYNGKTKAEPNIGIYATYISFFPLLAAGPIERTNHLLPQIKGEKKFDYVRAIYGARQMLWGFFKKIAVADIVAIYVDNAYSNLYTCTSFDLCAAIFFFSIQIYCDFSGYSDIAIGTAKLFGIDIIKNFSSPYFACSIRDFWSSWHISLSSWFRDYVYIPLGGNRCSKGRTYINLLITFLASGLWHGADWTYILWGGIHGIAQIVEKILAFDNKNKTMIKKVISWMIVFSFCNLAWAFFRADTVQDALYVIIHALGNTNNLRSYVTTTIGLERKKLIYIMFMILIVALYDYMSLKKDVIKFLREKNKFIYIAIEYCLVFFIIFALLMCTSKNQFVYFQF